MRPTAQSSGGKLNSYEVHRQKLIAIYTDGPTYVKQLRELQANRLADRLVVTIMDAIRLADRHGRFSVFVYARRVNRLLENYHAIVAEAFALYPALAHIVPDKRNAPPTRTVKVSITLRVDHWDYIDSLIAGKHFKSRGHYFRHLYDRKR